MIQRLVFFLSALAWMLGGGLFPLTAHAVPEPRFEMVGDAGAISDSVVSALVVDRDGFLWIGSAVGLVRFDGYEFRAVGVPNSRGKRDASSFVRSLLASRDGRIWVGTDNEDLAVYDPAQESWSFLRSEGFRGTVRSLVEGTDGAIWAGFVGGGLHAIDPKTLQITRWGGDQGLPDDRIQALMVDRDGQIWAGTWSGLAVRRAGQSRFELAPGELALKGRSINALYQDRRGHVWVGTQRGELLRQRGAVVEWLDQGDSGGGTVNALLDMAGDSIWLARGNGLEIRHQESGQRARLLQHSLSKPWGPAGSDVRTMTLDRSGVFWMGSYGGGLQRHTADTRSIWVRRAEPRADSVLGVMDVRSISQVPNGEIWVGTNARGVAVLGPDLALRAEIPFGISGHRGGRAGGIAHDANGHVWVGTEENVSQFDAQSRKFLHAYSLGKGRVRRMLGTRDGSVYAATQDGVYRWWPGQSGFERVLVGDSTQIAGDVNALAEGGRGEVWIGGVGGVYVVDSRDRQARKVDSPEGASLHGATVLGMLVDSRQRLWLDTSAGLHRMNEWDGKTARFQYFNTRKQALNGESFGANLLEDRQGRIWTHRGVYDPVTEHVQELSSADGVDIGTGWFRSYAGLHDGRMLFGGSRGILVLDPSRFTAWTYQPRVFPTKLWINGVSKPLASLNPHLVLPPESRGFQVEFTALDLSLPGRNRYRYRMLGVDADWLTVGASERQASYGGLAPGRYTLQVQGTNRNGEWSPHEWRQDIEVQPAWWQTVWARMGMGLLLVVGVSGIVQARTLLLRRQQLALEQQVLVRTQALEAASRALEDAATSDPLTGLRNRRFLTERLDEDARLSMRQHEEAQRQGRAALESDLCFFMIDVDHFKQVNDQHGHAAGDAVLVQMRERLREVFRDSDYLVRWGGEEFLVVARASDRAMASELAERARRAVGNRPFDLGQGRMLVRTCSIGFACFPLLPHNVRATGWMLAVELADAALYQAKRGGRNGWFGVQDAGTWDPQDLADLHPSGEALPAGMAVVAGPDTHG